VRGDLLDELLSSSGEDELPQPAMIAIAAVQAFAVMERRISENFSGKYMADPLHSGPFPSEQMYGACITHSPW
jgi:hypothetical protein